MRLVSAFFWISLFVVLYTYVFYAFLLYFINNIRKIFIRPQQLKHHAEPGVTLIVPAYNEANVLEAKIENCRQLSYPSSKLQFIFITDGSTDNSNDIIEKYPEMQLLFQPERRGKMAAINRAMQEVKTPVVIFSDANTLLNTEAVKKVVEHYSDEHIGGVAGEKKIAYTNNTQVGFGEGLYWQYESKMKQLDSDFNTVVGAAGELFSMRTSLFKPQPEKIILDDFVLSMKICLAGYKVIYEPLAYATETPSKSLGEEKKRRVRIAAGAFQSLVMLPGLLNVFKHPRLSFQYFSRRVCRWLLSPLALVVLYVSNAWLFLQTQEIICQVIFLAQTLFYLLALVGWIFYKSKLPVIWLLIPFYFVFMNFAMFVGLARYLKGGQPAAWEKAQRQ